MTEGPDHLTKGAFMAEQIAWRDDEDRVFDEAAAGGRPVLLDFFKEG